MLFYFIENPLNKDGRYDTKAISHNVIPFPNQERKMKNDVNLTNIQTLAADNVFCLMIHIKGGREKKNAFLERVRKSNSYIMSDAKGVMNNPITGNSFPGVYVAFDFETKGPEEPNEFYSVAFNEQSGKMDHIRYFSQQRMTDTDEKSFCFSEDDLRWIESSE